MSRTLAAQARAAGSVPADRPRQRRNDDPPGSPATVRAALTQVQVREQTDDAIRFTGYASVAERAYPMHDLFGEYDETVSRGAFARTLAGSPSVEFTINHGAGGGLPLAHTRNATLTLAEDSQGLRVDAQLDPRRSDVADLVLAMQRGDLAEMSFKFRILKGLWNGDYTAYRIAEVDIDRGDVSVVNFGANPYTSAGLRAQEQENTMSTVEEQNTITELRAAVAKLTEDQQMRANALGAAGPTATVHVGVEESVYREDHARAGETSWLKDLFRGQIVGDPVALERLARHGREVESRGRMSQRAVVSSGVGAFVPPQYLAELFAESARAGRPVADLLTRIQLPAQGMVVNVPRITTGSTVAAQAVEGTSIDTTDLDDTTLPAPVCTIAGYVDVSRQAIERGELVEAIIFSDLAAAYNAELDRQVLNGIGSAGQHTGIRAVSAVNTTTFTDATDPTFAELYPKIADAVGKVQSQRFSGPTAIVMHPRRWAWANAALSSSFPMIGQAGGTVNAAGTANAPGYGPVGKLFGVDVITDGNVLTNLGTGTNEDEIYVLAAQDLFLFEDLGNAPAQLRFDSVGSSTLTCRLTTFGYSALAAGRQPKAITIVSGSGLSAPA